MSRLTRTVTVIAVTCVALIGALLMLRSAPGQAVTAEQQAEPAPPEGQTYTGAKRCASCHFKQYLAWKKTGHSESFDLLTKKYENDPACLKCHTTGYGEPTGYKDASDTSLQGTTCETCHGPGSEHDAVCQKFKNQKLNAQQEKVARDSIWLMRPKNVCVDCHTVQGHGEPQTPPELRTKD